ncbi:MAG: flagellar assembly protein FliW [Chthonomonadales bacterium]|nr:flagellar assembly protein FliW [Chthonomonadales bacterium]
MTTTQTAWTARTTRFGPIEVSDDLVITILGGLIGFEACERFVVLRNDDASPLRWLQSLDDGSVAFPAMDPRTFMPEYSPSIPGADAAQLELTADTPRLLLTIVTIPRDNPRGMTANLLGPVVVNAQTRRGRQVIALNDSYPIRYRILADTAG